MLQRLQLAQPLRQDTGERGQLSSLHVAELDLQAGGGQGIHTEESELSDLGQARGCPPHGLSLPVSLRSNT